MFSKADKKKNKGTGVAPRPKGKALMPSIVAAGLHVTGNMFSDGDIQIEGAVEGDVRSQVLIVAEQGMVTGTVIADVVTVFGTVIGQIKARKVILEGTARVSGDVMHETVTIATGARVEGNFQLMNEAGKTGSGAETFRAVKEELQSKRSAGA